MFDLHIHSRYSDGGATVDEIARKAKEMGLKVIAIVDHSVEHRLGITEDKAKRRQMEIEEAREKYDIEILSGVECGILPEGEIQLPNFEFDLIIASIHDFLPVQEYYYRIKRCLVKYGDKIHILGHMHSDLFGSAGRDFVQDVEVIDLLVENDVALEINTAHRAPPLDFLEMCTNRRMFYSVGSDAHTLERVGDVKWGFEMAKRYIRKGEPIIKRLQSSL
jgi:putative hydrolase